MTAGVAPPLFYTKGHARLLRYIYWDRRQLASPRDSAPAFMPNDTDPLLPVGPLGQPQVQPAALAHPALLARAPMSSRPVPNYATRPNPPLSPGKHHVPAPSPQAVPISSVSSPVHVHHPRPSVVVQQESLLVQATPEYVPYSNPDHSDVNHVQGFPLGRTLPYPENVGAILNAGMPVHPTGGDLAQPLPPRIDPLHLPFPVEHPRSARRVEDVEVLQRFSLEVGLPSPERSYQRNASSGRSHASLRSPSSAKRSGRQEKPYDHGNRSRTRKD